MDVDDLPFPDTHAVHIDSIATSADAAAFASISEEWISRLFTVTPADRELLDNPFERIVTPGGDVLVARVDGTIVGCVALIAHGGNVFELSKMGVRDSAQGRGIGARLVRASLHRARVFGAEKIFLGTNTKLAPAIHLYERAGFRRITRDELPVQDYYARADVLMAVTLT